MYEIEPDLVAVTTKILEAPEEQLTNAQGRAKLDDIREHLNEYLVAQGEFPVLPRAHYKLKYRVIHRICSSTY